MRRNERERIERKKAFQASKGGFWMPKNITLPEYLNAVKGHPTMPEMLDYLENHPRNWAEAEEIEFANSKDGVCEKCSVRALNIDPTLELKSTTNLGFDGVDIHFSKYIAETFIKGKEPITLTPNLHREFVYQSWFEAAHLEHIPRGLISEPGIAAIHAYPELEKGVMNIALSFRAIDGSHRAALAYREKRTFSVRVLTPEETLKSIFAIGNKKNPLFARSYTKEADDLLEAMGRGEIGPNIPIV
jgi:hypothetical protein